MVMVMEARNIDTASPSGRQTPTRVYSFKKAFLFFFMRCCHQNAHRFDARERTQCKQTCITNTCLKATNTAEFPVYRTLVVSQAADLIVIG